MKVLIVGAGPAGLSFAALLAQSEPAHEITIIERRRQDQVPGWGVTLRTHTLSFLELGSRMPYQTLVGRACWCRGKLVVDLPYPDTVGLAGVSRSELLATLATSCSSVSYETDAKELRESDLAEYDLVVAADGAHSTLRSRYDEKFGVSEVDGKSQFAWLATDKPFDTLTLLLEDRDIPLLAWAYKYTETLSTLIVEASSETLEDTGLSRLSAPDACAAIARTFEGAFEGARVLSGDTIRWRPFPTITCERLHHGNIVLIGDAAHTAHFSQGFGTMFAFDDAIALHDALVKSKTVELALEAYEAERVPKIAEWQGFASSSMLWAEATVAALDARDDGKIRAQIEARWPNNEVAPAPMDSYSS